jgi:ABC-type multidrug transport system ATPase subunit
MGRTPALPFRYGLHGGFPGLGRAEKPRIRRVLRVLHRARVGGGWYREEVSAAPNDPPSAQDSSPPRTPRRAASSSAAETARVKAERQAAAAQRAAAKRTAARSVAARTAAAKTAAEKAAAKKAAADAEQTRETVVKVAAVKATAPRTPARRTPRAKTTASRVPSAKAAAPAVAAEQKTTVEGISAEEASDTDASEGISGENSVTEQVVTDIEAEQESALEGESLRETSPEPDTLVEPTEAAEPEADSEDVDRPEESASQDDGAAEIAQDPEVEQDPEPSQDEPVQERDDLLDPDQSYALVVRGLVKRFGDSVAVDRIDLTVPAGSFYGIVGPNGAGKTTTLSIIAGLLRADAGTVRISGIDQTADSRAAKRALGVLPDRLRTFDRLTGRQLLHYYGLLRGLPADVVEKRVGDLARAFDLTGALSRVVSDYSAGMTKKIMLAGAMIHSPRVLVLDEPFESVDPVSSGVILDILRAYVAHGGTVILSSHGMDLVERVCERIAIIVGGEVLAEGTIDEVRAGQTLAQRFIELSGSVGEVEGLEWLHSFSD